MKTNRPIIFTKDLELKIAELPQWTPTTTACQDHVGYSLDNFLDERYYRKSAVRKTTHRVIKSSLLDENE